MQQLGHFYRLGVVGGQGAMMAQEKLALLLPDNDCLVSSEKDDDDVGMLISTNVPSPGENSTTPFVSHVPHVQVSVTEGISAASSVVSIGCQPCGQPADETQQAGISLHNSLPEQSTRPHLDSESAGGERISTHLSAVKKSVADRDDNGASWARKISLDNGEANNNRVAKRPRTSIPCSESHSGNKVQAANQQRLPSTVSLVLLAQPTDATVLSPLHVFVRQQVEVFTATAEDICQPAPGRKNRIQLHQVGLRCIHCRDLPPRDRVKRAVCYPSSVGRVYHSVSDMKFDHFNHCKGFPPDIRAKFQELKQESKQKRPKSLSKTPSYMSSSTAQCYHDSACEMGMVDADGGLFMANDLLRKRTVSINGQCPESALQAEAPTTASKSGKQESPKGVDIGARRIHILPKNPHASSQSDQSSGCNIMNPQYCLPNGGSNSAMISSLASYLYTMNKTPLQPASRTRDDQVVQNSAPQFSRAATSPLKTGITSCLLTCPMDQLHLNPLHCFVRRHIEIFTADDNDIAAPAPGRKTRVVLGQVGLRCIHCASLPPKDRVKRAVCFPAAVAGIYHSVSNMKFDHFDKCRGLPESERAIFTALRSSCGRHGPRASANGRKETTASSNSTAQYYLDSAVRVGLVDSETGMRFGHEKLTGSTSAPGSSNSEPPQKSQPNHEAATDGISALMIAASVRAGGGGDAVKASTRETSL
jgi:hypothetical protein